MTIINQIIALIRELPDFIAERLEAFTARLREFESRTIHIVPVDPAHYDAVKHWLPLNCGSNWSLEQRCSASGTVVAEAAFISINDANRFKEAWGEK